MEESYDNMTFAKNLKSLMEEHGENQRALATVMGVSRTIISNWCAGKKLPRMDKVEKLATHYNVKKSDLIEDRNRKRSPQEISERISDAICNNEDLKDFYYMLTNLPQKRQREIIEVAIFLANQKKE